MVFEDSDQSFLLLGDRGFIPNGRVTEPGQRHTIAEIPASIAVGAFGYYVRQEGVPPFSLLELYYRLRSVAAGGAVEQAGRHLGGRSVNCGVSFVEGF